MRRVLAFIGLSVLGLGTALAEEAAAHTPTTSQGLISMLPWLIAFAAIFYFLLIRPQNVRAKQHRELISNIATGDEVLTNGGMLGKVVRSTDDFVVLKVAENVEVTLQKAAIANVLPKGTMKSV